MANYEVFSILHNDFVPKFVVPVTSPAYSKGTVLGGYPVMTNLPSETGTYEPESFTSTRSKPPSDGGSWKKKKESGRVFMTPYSRATTTQKDYLTTRKRAQTLRPGASYGKGSPPVCVYKWDPGLLSAAYSETRHFAEWVGNSSLGVKYLVESEFKDVSVQRAIETTRSAVVSNFLSGYDVLTELAELPQAIMFAKASASDLISILTSLKRGIPVDSFRRAINMSPAEMARSSDRFIREVGSRWLAYRYAVMPLVYSYMDIAKLSKNSKRVFKEFRSTQNVDSSHYNVVRPKGSVMVKNTSGSITVSSYIRAAYSSEALAKLASVSANPFRTAYELTKLSYVLGWFVNIGDVITARTGLDLSSSVGMCTSVRRNVTDTYVFADDYALYTHAPASSSSNGCGGWPAVSYYYESPTEETSRVVNVNSYVRTIFGASDVHLSLTSQKLTWQRQVDAAALSYSGVLKILKSIYVPTRVL